MKHIDYKIPGGKMIRLDLELQGNIIQFIRITGDFFFHPEIAIVDLENFLLGKSVTENLVAHIEDFFKRNNVRTIGIEAKHIVESLMKAL